MTVVPTATTRPPSSRVAVTSRAVTAGTSNHSAWGASPASCDDTPVCSVTAVTPTPTETSRVTSSGVNGLAALGISALPGRLAKTVWYAASG